MTTGYLIAGLAAMALTTYLVRMIPFVAVRKKVRSPFLRSFLYYMPYAVLGAMTLPAILYATGSLLTAAVGLAVALVLAWFKRSLLTVAAAACAAAWITGWLTTIL